MSNNFLKKLFSYSIFSFAVFLAFLLVFESHLKLPSLVGWLGHFHPLILHFPIVLILVTIVQFWRKDPNISIYVSLTTILTLLSAITGLVLSLEGGSKGQLILTHQWMGIAVSYLMVGWYWLSQNEVYKKNYYKAIHGLLVVLIVLTGHFGGMITHGKDFLALGQNDDPALASIPDDPIVFEHIVQPILNKKCVSCHNENKAKGALLLTDFSDLLQGGESGEAINQSEPGNSELLKRVLLPLENEDHMPPNDEQQLSQSELVTLSAWIELGARSDLKFSEISASNPLHPIIQDKIERAQQSKWSQLPEVTDEELSEFSSDYCNIMRMQSFSNALQVLIYPHKEYSPLLLQKLMPIGENIIELNVSNLPLGEQEMKTINSFSNLEKLNMSGTPIDDTIFGQLQVLEKLSFLKVYNTKLGPGSIDHLLMYPALSELYVYNTGIEDNDVKVLNERKASINVIANAKEAIEFESVLPVPTIEPMKYFFRDAFYINFKHPLEGIDLYYTTDGSDPNHDSQKVVDSMFIKDNFTIKYVASKAGWVSSPIDSILFLRTIQEPATYNLKYPADQKYLGIGKSLLFDMEKGSTNIGDDAWMAFRNNRFILTCEFDDEVELNSIVLSSMVHTNQYIFPPSSIQVKGGLTSHDMKLLGSLKPEQPKERQNQHFDYLECEINSKPLKIVQIIVEPLRKIPDWHRGKGESAWFFIDEVIFQE